MRFGEIFGEWGSPNEKVMDGGGCSSDVWPNTSESCPISQEGWEGLGWGIVSQCTAGFFLLASLGPRDGDRDEGVAFESPFRGLRG